MATLTINIPDAVAPRVLEAIAVTYAYDPAVNGTKAQFARATIATIVKDLVRSYEAREAAKAAQATAETAVNNDVVIS